MKHVYEEVDFVESKDTKIPQQSQSSATSGAVGHTFGKWEPAVVAHTLENTIKAVAKQNAMLGERYGITLAKDLFRLDPNIVFKKKRIKATATEPAKEITDNTPVFLDLSSRDLLVKRFLAKLATSNSAEKRFVVAFGGHSSAAAHGTLKGH